MYEIHGSECDMLVVGYDFIFRLRYEVGADCLYTDILNIHP